MIYILAGMSLLFVAMGFIITELNAKYFLSGYNTMNETERKKIDLTSYIPHFKKFHIWFGVSFFIIGSLLLYFVGEDKISLFLGVYPVAAYIYFFWRSTKHGNKFGLQRNVFTTLVLLGTLLFVTVMFARETKESKIILHSNMIEFQGSYGEQVSQSDILSVELIDHLPKITMRTNGFSSGSIKRGYFKTSEGERIKLILNADTSPYMLFTKNNGGKIYFAAKEKPTEELYNEIRTQLPEVLFK